MSFGRGCFIVVSWIVPGNGVWGEVKDASRTNAIKMTGGLEDQSGTTLARSEGLFAELPKEKLPFLPEDLIRDIEALYCKFPRNQ
ncbi:MAG: hypothetical protein HQK56_20365 [Deltaproteobacteria bacterium]|nr:hypothetical protein [Deltaproteobacteria bacterium]